MKLYLVIAILFATTLVSCEKSFERFEPEYPGTVADSVWATTNFTSLNVNQLHQELMPAFETDSFNLQQNTTLGFTTTSRVVIPANTFVSGGALATGTATAQFNLLKSKGDYIRFRKSSVSNGYLLQNKAVVYLNVLKTGQQLSVAATRNIFITVNDSAVNAMMKGYAGVNATAGTFASFNWVGDTAVNVYPDTTGYTMTTRRLQWLSFGALVDSSTAKSRTVVSMPSGFTNANTSVFMVYNNKQSVMQLTPDATNRIWLAEKVPIGESVVYVAISKLGNQYRLGTLQTTTAINQNIRITSQQVSLQVIDSYLNSL